MESPLAVVRLMSPAGILTASPGMMWRSKTEIYPQCNVGVVIGPPCARSSGFCRRLVRLLLSNLLKALTVGANTVKGGSRLVSLPKAVSRASRRVENLLSVARTCPVVGSEEPRHYTLSAPRSAALPLSKSVLARGRGELGSRLSLGLLPPLAPPWEPPARYTSPLISLPQTQSATGSRGLAGTLLTSLCDTTASRHTRRPTKYCKPNIFKIF